MLTQLSLLDTDSFTSSPASADGPLQPVLPDGPTTASLSPGRARVSRSRSRAKAPELLMRGTYGPTFSESSVPEGPLSSWENRLRQRLAKVGSSECDLTWKVSGTTPGELLSRLVPSTPRTVEIASGLLLDASYWSTPRASDGEKGGPNQAFGAGGQPLPAQAFHTAMWPTATAVDGARGLTTRPQDTGIPLPQRVGQVLGIPPAGSLATTEKRGVLNPAFPCWLMGYPIAWVYSGALAMQSCRKLPRK